MKIINKSKNEIINDEKINKSFLHARLNDLGINCKIYNGNFFSDSFNYFPITEKFETFKDLYNWQVNNSVNHFFSEKLSKYIIENKNKFRVINNTYLLGSSPGNNYYSNLIHFLPRVFFNDNNEINLTVHRNLSNKFRNFIRKIFKERQKKVNFVYLDDNFYLFENSMVPQFLDIKNSVKVLNYFINRNINKNNKTLKIYISRQNSKYRNIVNEDDLIKFLKGKGYRILDLNHFTIRNQIEMFAKAEVVISPTGSGLANIIFCKPGTKVIEIAPEYKKTYESNLSIRYENLSKIAGLDHIKIKADSIKTKKHSEIAEKYINKKILEESSYYSDLIVKINEFKELLN